MEKVYIEHSVEPGIAMGDKTRNWSLIAAMLLSGLVALVSGGYLLTA